MAGELSYYSWQAIIIGAWFGQFLWYSSMTSSVSETQSLQLLLVICLVASIAMMVFIPKLYSTRSQNTHLAMRTIIVATFFIGATALWHEHSYPVIGAISNIVYMIVLAWAALKIQSIELFNVMTALICIRLLFIYLF